MIAFTAGYLLKQHLSDMLPFVWCIIVLTLYVLAFFRGLSTIDIVMPIAAIVLLGIVMLKGKTERMTYVKYVQESALSISFITYVLLAIFICICVSGKVVTWWDDVNFWASDLKSLYYLNGFAGKYANVSPEFGDYPPAVQLAKWYIVHLNRSDFCEGMAFIGYYLFGLSFLMPIYKNVGVKKAYISLPFAIVSWLFAGIADKYGYAGFCADLTMAFIFGAILIEALRYKKEDGVIPGIRVGLYLAVLTLCKSTGAIWALFGLVIWCGAFFANNGKMTARKAINGLWIAVFPFFAGTTWILFCLTKHRVTKTTATAITYITTDDYSISFYTADFAKAFAKAFFTQPLHVDHVGITVPPAAMLLTIIVVFYTFIKKEYIRGKGGRFIAWALPIMRVLYCMLFILSLIS